MYSAIIVDDEYPARVLLNDYLSKIPSIHVAGIFKNALEASSFLQDNKVDMLFLDIQMPGLSGIELIRSLPVPTRIILTTAYPDYALEGFELSVTDYLLKPIRFERFLTAVNKAIHSLRTENASSENRTIIKIKADQKVHLVNPDDILYIEGLKEYVRIHFLTEKLVTLESLKNLESELPSQFMRIHKSYIINTHKIKSVTGNQVEIGDIYIPIGKTYREITLNELLGK